MKTIQLTDEQWQLIDESIEAYGEELLHEIDMAATFGHDEEEVELFKEVITKLEEIQNIGRGVASIEE